MDKEVERLLDELGELVIDGRLVVKARPARPPKAVRTPVEAPAEKKEDEDGE